MEFGAVALATVHMSDWEISGLKMYHCVTSHFSVPLVSGLLVPGQSSLLESVRFASKKSGGSSKNLGGKSPGRRYGFKKQDGNNELFETTSC